MMLCSEIEKSTGKEGIKRPMLPQEILSSSRVPAGANCIEQRCSPRSLLKTKKSEELGCHRANSNARNVCIRSAAIRVTPDCVPLTSQISHVKDRSVRAVGNSMPQTVGAEKRSGEPSAGLKLVVLGNREA